MTLTPREAFVIAAQERVVKLRAAYANAESGAPKKRAAKLLLRALAERQNWSPLTEPGTCCACDGKLGRTFLGMEYRNLTDLLHVCGRDDCSRELAQIISDSGFDIHEYMRKRDATNSRRGTQRVEIGAA